MKYLTPRYFFIGEPSSDIFYLDVNNLYEWAMCKPVPFGRFDCVNKVDEFDFNCIADNASKLILEVEYPKVLHKIYQDLRPSKKFHSTQNYLNLWLLSILKQNILFIMGIWNMRWKIVWSYLKSTQFKLFKFKVWLKSYIELKTKLRTEGTFEINLCKLTINDNFGKTMENSRKHRIIKWTNKWEGRYDAKNVIAHPAFHNWTISDEHLIVIELNKIEIV